MQITGSCSLPVIHVQLSIGNIQNLIWGKYIAGNINVYGQNSAKSNRMCDVCYNWLKKSTYSTKLAHYFVYATYETLQLESPTSQNPTERQKINIVHFPCNYIMFIIFNSHLVAQCFYLPITAPTVFGPSCWPSLMFDIYSSIFSLLFIFTRSRACFTLRNTNMHTYIHTYIHMYTHIHTHTRTYVRMYVYMYLMYVMYVCIY